MRETRDYEAQTTHNGCNVGVVDPSLHVDWTNGIHDHDGVGVRAGDFLNEGILEASLSEIQIFNGEREQTPLCHALRLLRSPALPSTVM